LLGRGHDQTPPFELEAAHRAVSGNQMLAVSIGRLGHSDAEIVTASRACSGYVAGHGGGHISKWLGRVNRGMDCGVLQLNPAGEMSI